MNKLNGIRVKKPNTMEIDYYIIVPILVAAIALLVFVIIRNQKDEKKFEEDMNKDSGDPESHPSDKI